MASPLLEYANTLIRVFSQGTVSFNAGRPALASRTEYVVKCYLKRAQYSGVTSGSKKLPLESQLEGRMLPGASGDQFYYRGYALQKAVVPVGTDWRGDLSSVTFIDIVTQESILLPGTEVDIKFGDDPQMKGAIQRSSGVFGGQGIDEIIYAGIGGVEIQITGSEIQN